MPNYLIATGRSAGLAQARNVTTYYFSMGYLYASTTEANQQLIARDSYTLSNLYVYVSVNAKANATTITSRKQTPPAAAADGNQTISIAGGQTGGFTDAVNTDSLVDSDLFCTKIVTADEAVALGITFTIISYILATAANTTPILAVVGSTTQAENLARYRPIVGNLFGPTSTETRAYYMFRVAATLSNLRASISANSVTATSTLIIRINGGNGSQSVSIGSTTTGAFEDTTNSDNISVGQNVNFLLTTGAGGTSITCESIQMKSNSAGKQVATAALALTSLAKATTTFVTIEGDSQSFNATEALVQATARCAFSAKNMYVNISVNTVSATSVFTLRKDTADSALTVSVGANATGQFEDTDHTVGFVAASLINWGIVTGASGTSITIACIGFELAQPVGGEVKIADTIQLVWDVRVALAQSVKPIWNVRAIVSDSLNAIWNVGLELAKTVRPMWNIRAIVTDSMKAVWNVKTILARAEQYLWNVRRSVADVVALKWNVSAFLSDSVKAIWNVLSGFKVADTIKLVWNTRFALAQNVKPVWNIRAFLSNTIKGVWNVRALLTDSMRSIWNVRVVLSDSVRAIFNVSQFIVNSIKSVWNVRARLVDSVNIIWNTRTQLAKAGQYIWNVLASVAIADAVQFVWNVRARLVNSVKPVWNIRAFMTDSLKAVWNVLITISVADTVRVIWNVKAQLAKAVRPIWNIRAFLADSLQTIWNVRLTLSDAVKVVWNARAILTDSVKVIWNVRKYLANSTKAIWNVLTGVKVSDAVQLVWDVRQFLANSSRAIWNVLIIPTPPVTPEVPTLRVPSIQPAPMVYRDILQGWMEPWRYSCLESKPGQKLMAGIFPMELETIERMRMTELVESDILLCCAITDIFKGKELFTASATIETAMPDKLKFGRERKLLVALEDKRLGIDTEEDF